MPIPNGRWIVPTGLSSVLLKWSGLLVAHPRVGAVRDRLRRACWVGLVTLLIGCQPSPYLLLLEEGALEDACTHEGGANCTDLGILYAKKAPGSSQLSGARALFDQGCKSGHARGCYYAGLLVNYGYGQEADWHRARVVFQTACGQKFSLACVELARLYARGEGGEPDRKAQSRFNRQACDGGAEEGCGYLYEPDGERVLETNEATAARAQEMCDMGDAPSCTDLGVMLERGIGRPQDLQAAYQYIWSGCEGGHARGCTLLGQASWAPTTHTQEPSRIEQLFVFGCEHGHALGCTALVDFYARTGGATPPAGQIQALYRKACEGGAVTGCRTLGIWFDIPPDAKAHRLERACAGREPTACLWLGEIYDWGRGTAFDPAKAANYYHLACDRAVADGCRRLADLYRRGKGVPADTRRATALDERAYALEQTTFCGQRRGQD